MAGLYGQVNDGDTEDVDEALFMESDEDQDPKTVDTVSFARLEDWGYF